MDSIYSGRGDHKSTYDSFNQDCEEILSDTILLDTLRSLQLDLVVVDVFPLNKCLVLIPHVLNIPFVYQAGCPEPSWKYRIPSMPSVIPIIKPFGTPYTEKMSFFERTHNFILHVILHVWFFPAVTDYEMVLKYRRNGQIKDYDDIALQAEMFFFDRDHMLDYSRWSLPNAIALGGLTARDSKPLLPDWKQWADSAYNGFFIISFGSVVDSFPQEVIDKMAEAFRIVNYHVVWRIGKNITGLPKRIKVVNCTTIIINFYILLQNEHCISVCI